MKHLMDRIINSKYFYREHYRRSIGLLYVSLIISACLLVAIAALLTFHSDEPGFYASNGVTAPILLKPMDAPNMSSKPLLLDLGSVERNQEENDVEE